MAIATSTAVALALAAAAAGGTYYNQQNVAKKQDNVLAGQLRSQAQKQRQADAKTAELIAKEEQSTDADERQSSLEKYTEAIRARQASMAAPLSKGDVSDAYKAAGSNAALGVTDYATKIAGLLSNIDAPVQQRQNDALVRGRYATDIDNIRRFGTGDDYLAQLRLRSIRPNPWIAAGSAAAGAYAGNYSGGGGTSQYQGWLNNDPTYAGPQY